MLQDLQVHQGHRVHLAHQDLVVRPGLRVQEPQVPPVRVVQVDPPGQVVQALLDRLALPGQVLPGQVVRVVHQGQVDQVDQVVHLDRVALQELSLSGKAHG
jgi:hypothetical protein